MKRILAMLLTVAMIATACPMVFADEVTEESDITVTENLSAEALEKEKNSEEAAEDPTAEDEAENEATIQEGNISLFAAENEISLMSADEVQYSTDGSAWTSSTLADAVSAIGANTGTIKVTQNITLTATLNITGNITMVSDGTDVTIKRSSTLTDSPMVEVKGGATLTLGTETPMSNTLTFDGNRAEISAKAPIAVVCGNLTMNKNVILQNNLNTATALMDISSSGGAVGVDETGTFAMNGGSITNNGMEAFYAAGGAIFNWGTCIINDGEIMNNAVKTTNNSGYGFEGGDSIYCEGDGVVKISNSTISSTGAAGGSALAYTSEFINDAEGKSIGGKILSPTLELSGTLSINCDVYVSCAENNQFKDATVNPPQYWYVSGKPTIKVTDTLTTENPIVIGGVVDGFLNYVDDDNPGEWSYSDLYSGYELIEFANNLDASDYENSFTYIDDTLIYKKDTDGKNVLELADVTKSAVTVVNPTYNNVSSDVSLGTIKVTGADNLTAAPEGTELTLSIEDESVADAKNHMFARWVVTKDSDGSEVTVTDNKFTMPGEAVTVKAEYTPKIMMTFYVNSASTSNECTGTWDGTSNTITFTLPGGRGTMTLSADKFTGWKYMYAEDKTPTVTSNDTVTVTVNLNKGYIYNGISSVTSPMGTSSTKLHGTFNNTVGSNTSTFTVPVGTYVTYKGEQTAEIILDIPKVEYNITKNYNTNEGSVEVVYQSNPNTQITKAYHGSTIWVGVEPKTNYKIKSVKVTDAESNEVTLDTRYVEQYNTWQFTMPINDVTIDVTFELDACEITASATNGTISGITSPAPIGSEVTFTLTPEDDTYELGSYKVFKTGDESTTVSVTDNGDGTYTFTMPEYPVTVSASFIKKTHDVTITKDGDGTVSISPETPVTVGETVAVAATPDENWELSTLTMNGTDITSTKSFTMPNEAVSIHAVFVKKKFAVTVDVTEEHSENGAVVCEVNGTDVEWGTEVNFTVEPNQYYDVDTVTVNGMTVTPGEDGKYKFDAAAQENKISATFKKQQFKLKDNTPAVDTSKGTVAIIKDAANVNDTKLDWGTRVTVTVTPEENWEIDTVKINGKDISEFENDVLHETMRTFSLMSVSSAKTYTVLIPTYDAELVVTYKKSQFTVTKSATENGTISIIEPVPDAEGNIKLDWDETVKINVTPDSHYDIDTVTVDGTVVAVDAQGDYSFTMPTHDVTISATFKKTKYSITGTGDHVTFDIPNTSAYDWGDTVEFTATPDQWYNIRSVTADNATVTITKVPDTDNTYSFTMPSGNITITAVTERPNFSVTFASNGGSSVAAKVVANGDAVAKPEVPVWAGRGFAGWYLDEECTQKYDFTQPVTGNLELYARWFLWGDVNNDGVADSYDALLIRRCRVGLTDYSMITNRMAGFVNGFEEGRRYPDSGDAVSIRRYRVGLISRYKVEDSAAGYEYDLENDTYIPNN